MGNARLSGLTSSLCKSSSNSLDVFWAAMVIGVEVKQGVVWCEKEELGLVGNNNARIKRRHMTALVKGEGSHHGQTVRMTQNEIKQSQIGMSFEAHCT